MSDLTLNNHNAHLIGPIGLDRRTTTSQGFGLETVVSSFTRQTYEAGLDFGSEHAELTSAFITALATKPFVVFSGLSGAGKTRLATSLGQWFGRERLLVQPVRPDWTSPESVLGFENPNSEKVDSQHAWNVPRTCEFILSAIKEPDEPYLLVLDEMNLAHVEMYFADVLSGMESGQPIIPNLQHDGSGWRIPRKDLEYLPWPKNLFLVGTINIDETTYRFSPKVLDRATSIEFRVLPGALKNEYPRERTVRRGEPELLHAFLAASLAEEPEWRSREQLAHSLQHLHRLLFDHEAEFGHRVFREGLRFGCLLADAGTNDPKTALDFIILYKVLPKFENAGVKDVALMQALAGFTLHGPGSDGRGVDPLEPVRSTPLLPRSFGKIRRLTRSFSR